MSEAVTKDDTISAVQIAPLPEHADLAVPLPEGGSLVENRQAPAAVAGVGDPPADPFFAILERAARDPSCDPVKFEKLYELSERARADRARRSCAAAFARLLADLPTIDRTGKIVVYKKVDRDKPGGPVEGVDVPQQVTPYATLDGILQAIRQPMAQHGFGIRFEYATVPPNSAEGRIQTTAVLWHEDGHELRASAPPLMWETSGSKNNVQAGGSSMTYGRRYSLLAVLPIVSHAPEDRDDDGTKTGDGGTIGEERAAELQQKLAEAGGDLARFLEALRIPDLASLPSRRLEEAQSLIARKAAKAKKETGK